MRKRTVITLAIVLALLGGLGFGAWKGYEWLETRMNPDGCYLQVDGADEPLRLTSEQAMNASIIAAESYNRDLPEQAAVIALATAWQESGLRNLGYGDRDSLGLFQQRPSYDWGTKEQIMDPWYSSGRFYEELVKFDNWESIDVNDIAQKVQRSGHPEAYRKHETNARALAGAFRGSKEGVLACLNREGTGTDRSGLDKVVATVPGVEIQGSGSETTLTASSPSAAWSVAQLAIANSADAGLTKVAVGDNEWRQDVRSWKDLQPLSGEATKVTLNFTS
ncbi:hypothetical protein [Arachnia rubra]|jgi:hypothetical protein|uniref:Lipoprotein n=1 Tax=Arachnia rubra TaxID=1547448 RepID=A0ABX7Y2H0_9ACTN|nr:hypothetical protein [Arachnia rubra]QUC07176.1 hypothetical protein J5A65_09465 [Arachnia rubra]BCR81434.1 hypothetical protein SK1NUM_18770 [Arachnia rubra]